MNKTENTIFVISGFTIIAEKSFVWNVEARKENVLWRVSELNQIVSLYSEANKEKLFLLKWKEVSKLLREDLNGDKNCPDAENVIVYSCQEIPLI